MGIDHLERWQSGRLHLTRNQEFLCGNREFESPPFLNVSPGAAAGGEERAQLGAGLFR
jgi:hypothetical protein